MPSPEEAVRLTSTPREGLTGIIIHHAYEVSTEDAAHVAGLPLPVSGPEDAGVAELIEVRIIDVMTALISSGNEAASQLWRGAYLASRGTTQNPAVGPLAIFKLADGTLKQTQI